MASKTIGFRPNEEDRRILSAGGENTTATIRRALRLLDHERWLDQYRADALATKDFDPNTEPEAW